MQLRENLVYTSKALTTILTDFFTKQHIEAVEIDPLLGRSVSLLSDFTLRGGKYVRGFLTVVGYELASGKKATQNVLKAAASVDLHHRHILILDDISDRDESRYGGPTVEHAYRPLFSPDEDGQHRARSFAMLDGVLLGSFARQLLLSTSFDLHILVRTLKIFDTIMYRDTLAGWQIHGIQAIEPLPIATQEQFIKGLRYVTASYTFEGPLLVGYTLADSTDKKLRKAIQDYSRLVGTAFQMHDDYLGLFGNQEVTGKPVGNDVREGKKTLLLQYAYQEADKVDKAFLEKVCGNPHLGGTDISRVQEIVQKTGALDHMRSLEKEYVAKGKMALAKLPDSHAKQQLLDVADYIIAREK